MLVLVLVLVLGRSIENEHENENEHERGHDDAREGAASGDAVGFDDRRSREAPDAPHERLGGAACATEAQRPSSAMRLKGAFEEKGDEGDYPTDLNLPNPLQVGRTRLVIVNESILNTHVLPERGVVVLGRGPEAEIYVPHASVSRRHAVIRTDRDEVTIEDLGSSNGTTVNNLPITPGRRSP